MQSFEEVQSRKAAERQLADGVKECVKNVRKKLAETPSPDNPGGFVICRLAAHEHIDLVSEELTSEELKRVRFRVKS